MSSLAAHQIVSDAPPAAAAGHIGPVLVLSSSLLTERMFLYTEFLQVLRAHSRVSLWSTSAGGEDGPGADVREPFPHIRPYREFPYNLLRRLNDFTWDATLRTASRQSIRQYRRYSPVIRMLKGPARVLAAAGLAQPLEDRLERWLEAYPRSEEAVERLRRNRPALLLTTGPFQSEQPAVVTAARRLGIPVVALIPSWDNVSTKNRMVFKYDGYLVWSEWTRRELHTVYPRSRNVPVSVVGAPQFDVFFQERFRQSREAFCRTQGLSPDRQIIVHAIGSPNFIHEHHAALDMARAIVRGDFGDAQLLVRPHPIHDNGEFDAQFRSFGSRVVVQRTAQPGTPLAARTQDADQIREWVNTFRHADVVVNLSSTVAIDAAIFDRPVVNLDYDPEPGAPNQALVKDVNHVWSHFKPIAESGGVWLVDDAAAMINATRTYLAHPELHREERRAIAALVCQHLDGRCGARMAHALIDFAGHLASLLERSMTTAAAGRLDAPRHSPATAPRLAPHGPGAARVVIILPRGEAIRNFAHSGAIDEVARRAVLSLVTVLPNDGNCRVVRAARTPRVRAAKRRDALDGPDPPGAARHGARSLALVRGGSGAVALARSGSVDHDGTAHTRRKEARVPPVREPDRPGDALSGRAGRQPPLPDVGRIPPPVS